MSINLPAFHRPLAPIWLHSLPTCRMLCKSRLPCSDQRLGLFVGGDAVVAERRDEEPISLEEMKRRLKGEA